MNAQIGGPIEQFQNRAIEDIVGEVSENVVSGSGEKSPVDQALDTRVMLSKEQPEGY